MVGTATGSQKSVTPMGAVTYFVRMVAKEALRPLVDPASVLFGNCVPVKVFGYSIEPRQRPAPRRGNRDDRRPDAQWPEPSPHRDSLGGGGYGYALCLVAQEGCHGVVEFLPPRGVVDRRDGSGAG